jgi:hypothetical protein
LLLVVVAVVGITLMVAVIGKAAVVAPVVIWNKQVARFPLVQPTQ